MFEQSSPRNFEDDVVPYLDAAYNLARWLTRNDQDAEDVVQDAFCGLYRAWDRLSSHDNAVGYLRVSVVNGCRSAVRRSGSSTRRVARKARICSSGSARKWNGTTSRANSGHQIVSVTRG